MSVSILTVVKNNHKYISLTIESVISQSFKNIEYIIVDGYSEDGTFEILKEYEKKYSFIKVFRNKDRNVYTSINFGIKKAKKNYLHLIHAGDLYYSNNSLADIYKFTERKSLDFSFSAVLFYNNDFKAIRYWNYNKKNRLDLESFYKIPHTTLFIKKKIYKKLFYAKNLRISADLLYIYQLIKMTSKFSYLDNISILMKNKGLSTDPSLFFLKILEDIKVYIRLYKYFFLFKIYKKYFSKISSLILNKFFIIKKNFYLKRRINFLDKDSYFNYITEKTIKIKFRYNLKNNKYTLSGLNIAFLGSLMTGKIKLYKDLFHWPDGFGFKLFYKKNIKKIPGRVFFRKLELPKFINTIVIIGNLSFNGKIFLKNYFLNKKIIHIKVPYTTPYNLYKLLPKFSYNQLIFITISTPKQEMLAEHIYRNNRFSKVICIGGSIEILSGQEKVVPSLLEKMNLEFVWRLKYDFIRRTKRLIFTFFESSKIYFKNYKIKIIN